jgi:hypothetical protein
MDKGGNDNIQTRQQADSLDSEVAALPESAGESGPAQPESGDPTANTKSSGLSLKDKLTLSISSLALLLSIAGLTYQILNNRIQERRAQAQEARARNQELRLQKQEDEEIKQNAENRRRSRQRAYILGKKFTLAYVAFLHTNQGSPRDIAATKESAKRYLDLNTRELAISLGLNPDLRSYLEERESGDVFGSLNGPFQSLANKLASFNSNETVAAFNVGSSLWYLVLQNAFANTLNNQEPFKVVFPLFRDLLNRNLKILGVNDESMLPEFDNMEAVGRRLGEMKKKYDVEFGDSK